MPTAPPYPPRRWQTSAQPGSAAPAMFPALRSRLAADVTPRIAYCSLLLAARPSAVNPPRVACETGGAAIPPIHCHPPLRLRPRLGRYPKSCHKHPPHCWPLILAIMCVQPTKPLTTLSKRLLQQVPLLALQSSAIGLQPRLTLGPFPTPARVCGFYSYLQLL